MAETTTGTTLWESLEQWSATAFLVGGALWLVFTVYNGLKMLNIVAPPPTFVNDALLVFGFLASFLGLFAFYPRVADDTPRLARAGAGVAAIGAVGFPVDRGVALVVSVVEGTPFDDVTTGLEPLYMVTFFGALIAFLLFSAASFRAHSPSRTVSLLLLVPPVMLLTYLLGSAVVASADVVLVIWGAIAVGWLALGYRLRSEPTPPNHAEPAPTEVQHD